MNIQHKVPANYKAFQSQARLIKVHKNKAMKKIVLLYCFLVFVSILSYGQSSNQLFFMLENSILASKQKYDSFPSSITKDYPLILCCDGLPNPYLDNCKSFYENIGMETLSWHYSKEYWKELKQGINVMEVYYELKDNLMIIYVALSTAKRNRKNITQAYWFEDVDKYIYEYSCETNEWRLVEE